MPSHQAHFADFNFTENRIKNKIDKINWIVNNTKECPELGDKKYFLGIYLLGKWVSEFYEKQ